MLKKLVKYGNSSALVLDKALLELLNMSEGSVVKIKTDGVSLIITPHHVCEQEKIPKSVTPEETLHEAVFKTVAQQSRNEEDARMYRAELTKVMAKYANALRKWTTPEVHEALQILEERFNGNRSDPNYTQALIALQQKYAPELIEMDKEIQALSQNYVLDEHRYKDDAQKSTFALATADFKKLHEKYQHVLQALAMLSNNADYIHESVLLAEKYQATSNSSEYVKEYHELIARYIPEYANYQHEMVKIAESFK